MTLLAAFQVLLYRYTGQKDIVIGTPIANRHYQEIEGLIGFFVNTLALRTTFEDNETFSDVLNKVKETTLQAYQHQDVPFDKLVDHLNISRVLNRNPVFQVEFSLHSPSFEWSSSLHKLFLENIHIGDHLARFDIRVLAIEDKENLFLNIEYSQDLFETETIKRMGDHFKELIEGILSNPTQDIQTLSLLTNPERHQLLIEWNDTKTDYPEDKTIHQLFEQVTKAPTTLPLFIEIKN